MSFIQELVAWETYEEELSGVLSFDRCFLCLHRYFGGRRIRMFHRNNLIRHILLKETTKHFRIQIGNRAEDEKKLHPGDRGQCMQRVADRQRMEKSDDEKDADIFLDILPTFVCATGQLIQESNSRRKG